MAGAFGAADAGFGAGGPIGVPGGIGIPGLGFQKNLNLDVGGGFGGIPGGFLGGGFPGFGGGYVPMTPLGAMGGIKGDLIVPMVAIGVALFLLVLIVLAVKYALAWKLSVLDDLSGPKKWKREAGSAAAPQLEEDYMIQLAKIVTSAIYSGSCSDRMICEVGAFARGNAQTVKGIISLVDSYVPANYHSYLDILRSSAEGQFDCGQKFQCNSQQSQGQPGQVSPVGDKGAGLGVTPSAPAQVTPPPPSATGQSPAEGQQHPQAQTPRPVLKDLFKANETRPAQKLGKFRRHIQ